jgi:hypothetical protein
LCFLPFLSNALFFLSSFIARFCPH